MLNDMILRYNELMLKRWYDHLNLDRLRPSIALYLYLKQGMTVHMNLNNLYVTEKGFDYV